MQRTIDYRPFFEPVDRHEVQSFRRAHRQPRTSTDAVIRVIALVISGLSVAFFAVASIVMAVSAFVVAKEGDPIAFVALVWPAAVLVVVAVLSVRALRSNTWERRYRLHRFAQANGLVYSAASPAPSYSGAIFQIGSGRHALDHLRTRNGRFLDYGNFRFTTGSGKSRRVHTWGFLALHLDRVLPHMVLDARANNGLLGTNLPMAFARDQRLSLEGDFDQHFTLYCPKEYERDALTVFTPDLMALLIDHAAPFDVEIVDDWMFVYSSAAFDMSSPALHQRLLHIVDTVGAKALRQTDRYRDERIGDFAANIVTPRGRRLRRGVSITTVVVVAAILVMWAGLIAVLVVG